MAITLNLPYVRFVRQVTTGPGANPQFVALMEEGLAKLKTVAWQEALNDPATVAMPTNDPVNFVPNDKYDVYKASKTVAGSGVQSCNLGMVAYRFKIPSDAVNNDNFVKEVTATLGADKFAYSGIKAAVVLSQFSAPPTDWDLLTKGGFSSVVDTTNKFATYDATPEVYGVLNSRAQASVADATNKAESFTFDLSAISISYPYLYLVLTMFDYTDYRANRPYWIEGSGIINGDSVSVTFTSDVIADPSTKIWYGMTLASSLVADPVEASTGNWTQLVKTSPGVVVRGTENEATQHKRWSCVLASVGTDVTEPVSYDGSGGSYQYGGYGIVEGDSTLSLISSARFFAVPPLYSKIIEIQFDASITTPSPGTEIGYTLYQVFGIKGLKTMPSIDELTYKDIDFWRGKLTSLSLGGMGYVANPIFSRLTDVEITGNTDIPVVIPSSSVPSMLCLLVYVHNINASPGIESQVPYGSLSNVTAITLKG